MIAKRKLPYAIRKERNDAGRNHAGAAPGRKALTLQTESKRSPGRAGAFSNPGEGLEGHHLSLSRRSDTIPAHKSGKARIA